MLCYFDGNAYLSTAKGTAEAGKGLVGIRPDTPVSVVPWDGSPPFVLRVGDLPCVRFGRYCSVALPPSPTHYALPPRTVAAGTGGGCTARLVERGTGELTLRTPDGDECVFPVPAGLGAVAIRCGERAGERLFALTAQCGGDRYVFVAAQNGDGWQVRLDRTCDGIEQRDGKTFVLTLDTPCGTVGTVHVYDAAFRPVDSYPVLTGKRVCDDAAMLLFEYAQAENAAGIASVVTADLFSAVPATEIVSYCKPYARIARAKPHPDGIYALVDGGGEGTLARFALVDGKVDNIEEYVPPPEFFDPIAQL